MAKRIKITFSNDHDKQFHHRVLNFCEALYTPIVADKIGTLCDVDQVKDSIWIELHDSHDMGHVKSILRKLLASHNLTADAIVKTD